MAARGNARQDIFFDDADRQRFIDNVGRVAQRFGWATPNEVKAQFANASILKDGCVMFNIAGNKYRLVAWINYPYRVV